MEKITGIYKITNQINEKIYIGLSTNCIRRWWDHYSKSYNSSKKDDIEKPLYRAMRKYGRENFSFEIIEECEEEKLSEREIYWIDFYDSYEDGYNATRGGDRAPEGKAHHGEDHPCAKLTEEDVKRCRRLYKEGYQSHEVWKKDYSSIVKYSTFQNMWHGRTWKLIMPEVFENNPHPRQKFKIEEVALVKKLFQEGKSYKEIYQYFDGYFSKTTINDICHERRYKDVKPASDVTTITESGE